jgi:hypothetical protein
LLLVVAVVAVPGLVVVAVPEACFNPRTFL